MLDNLAIFLLGLEPNCYAKATQQEKSYIQWVLLSFTAVLISCLAAMFVTGFFVAGNLFAALIIMVLGSFVFISIFRFSLILIKPELRFLVTLHQVVLQTTWKEKWQQARKNLKLWRSFFKNIRWNSDAAIPSFTLVFRLIYMGLMAFVLVFPLTTLFHWERTMAYNQTLRDKALKVYTTELNQPVLADKAVDFKSDQNLSWYEEKVSKEYFTMQLFKHASTYTEFGLIIWLVGLMLFLPHYFLFHMMRKKEFVYQAAVQAHFKELIEGNFNELDRAAHRVLSKYRFFDPTIHVQFLHKGNPFQEKEEYPVRENIRYQELQERINPVNPGA